MENMFIDISNNESKYDEFKLFVSNHTEFYDFVKDKKVTWQELYDLYDKYGANENIFEKYYGTNTISNTTTSSQNKQTIKPIPTSTEKPKINPIPVNNNHRAKIKPLKNNTTTNQSVSSDTLKPDTSNSESAPVVPASNTEVTTGATSKPGTSNNGSTMVAPATTNVEVTTDVTSNSESTTVTPTNTDSNSTVVSGSEILVDPNVMSSFATSLSTSASGFELATKKVGLVAGSLAGAWKGSSYDSFSKNCESVATASSNIKSKVDEIGNAINAISKNYSNADQRY